MAPDVWDWNKGFCIRCLSPLAVSEVEIVSEDEPDWDLTFSQGCRVCGLTNPSRVFYTEVSESKMPPQNPELSRLQSEIDRSGSIQVFSAILGILLQFPIFYFFTNPAIPRVQDVVAAWSKAVPWFNEDLQSGAVMAIALLPIYVQCLFHYTVELHSRRLKRRATVLQCDRNRELIRLEQRPPVFLLRSFLQSSLSRHSRTIDYSTVGLHGDGLPTASPGQNIVQTLEKWLGFFGRPVALGIPKEEMPESGEHEIVFVRTDDTTWEQAFQVLARHSRFLFLVPGSTPGVIKEMEAIRDQGFCARTFVYMPPAPKGSPDQSRIQKEWQRTREYCAKYRFALPEHEADGMLFVPDERFSIRDEWYRWRLEPIASEFALIPGVLRAISALMPRLQGNYGTVSSAIRRIPASCKIELI